MYRTKSTTAGLRVALIRYIHFYRNCIPISRALARPSGSRARGRRGHDQSTAEDEPHVGHRGLVLGSQALDHGLQFAHGRLGHDARGSWGQQAKGGSHVSFEPATRNTSVRARSLSHADDQAAIDTVPHPLDGPTHPKRKTQNLGVSVPWRAEIGSERLRGHIRVERGVSAPPSTIRGALRQTIPHCLTSAQICTIATLVRHHAVNAVRPEDGGTKPACLPHPATSRMLLQTRRNQIHYHLRLPSPLGALRDSAARIELTS